MRLWRLRKVQKQPGGHRGSVRARRDACVWAARACACVLRVRLYRGLSACVLQFRLWAPPQVTHQPGGARARTPMRGGARAERKPDSRKQATAGRAPPLLLAWGQPDPITHWGTALDSPLTW